MSADVWKAAGTRPTAGGWRLGRWANREGGGTVSVWVSGLGGTYLECGCVEGSRDVSHRGWTAACQLGRWVNREGGGMVSVWVSGLGSTYLECGRVEGGGDASHSRWTAAWQVGEWRGQGHGQEGGRDASHSRWMVAWCLTMSKSRRQVFLIFFRSTHVAWGARVGDTTPKKLPPCPPLPCCHRCLHSLDVTPSMAPCLCACVRTQPRVFFATPASR